MANYLDKDGLTYYDGKIKADIVKQLADYLLKTGGVISGNLSIIGDFEVRGTTKTTEEETLNVKDSIVVTNSNGADLSATLAGFVIRLNATDCYGIIYDKSSDSVKLGLGKITDGKFVFNTGEGEAVATRADSTALTDKHLIQWDGTNFRLVDSGKSIGDITAALDKKLDIADRPKKGYAVYTIAASSYGADPKTVPVKWEPESDTLPGRTDKGTLRAKDAITDDDLVTLRQFKTKLSKPGEAVTEDSVIVIDSEGNTTYKKVSELGSGGSSSPIASIKFVPIEES